MPLYALHKAAELALSMLLATEETQSSYLLQACFQHMPFRTE